MARDVPLAVQDSSVLENLEAATYQIELQGIAPNCAASPSGPYSATVDPGSVVVIRLEIACRGVLSDVVLFTKYDGTGPEGIRVMGMRPDGSDLEPYYHGAWARLSPNGEEVVYVSWANFEFGLRRMRVDSVGGVVVLSTGLDQFPDWSPDGTQIAFTSDQSGQWQLYTMDRNGNSRRRLTASDRQETGSRWSPDGTRILIGRESELFGTDLVVVQLDGSGETTIATGTAGAVAWSPDGTRILYHDLSGPTNRIGVMNADGSQPHPVTEGGGISAVWSPDGSEIMFSLITVGIFRADASGANPVLVHPSVEPLVLNVWR
jgi:hypothetical protein